jgi:adenosylmethionine-8-amino-7-oxononanoate aminotransferase
LPVAATLTTSRIYDAFYDDYEAGKTLFHGHSYTGNPLGCAVALANLRLFEEENILTHVQSSAQFVRETLATWHPIAAIGDIRQRGLMVGIELVENRNTKQPYPSARRMGYHATQRMRELGLLTRPLGDTIVFMPPLASTHDELREMLRIIRQAIEDVTQPPYSSFAANKA